MIPESVVPLRTQSTPKPNGRTGSNVGDENNSSPPTSPKGTESNGAGGRTGSTRGKSFEELEAEYLAAQASPAMAQYQCQPVLLHSLPIS